MLILTRRISENLIIGEGAGQITIMVTEVNGGQVRLGVTAPKGITIFREEIYKRIQASKQEQRKTR